jgi:hypothetical protein
MQPGDVVRIDVGGRSVCSQVECVEPRETWNGRSLDGWIDAVVLRLEGGRRLRFKRGVIEESDRFQLEPRLC